MFFRNRILFGGRLTALERIFARKDDIMPGPVFEGGAPAASPFASQRYVADNVVLSRQRCGHSWRGNFPIRTSFAQIYGEYHGA